MDHDEIRKWAERFDGAPIILDHPGATADRPGIRIEFPGDSQPELTSERRPATWDEFFRVFDDQQLLLSFDDQPEGDDPSEWYHFEKQGAAEEDEPEPGGGPGEEPTAGGEPF